MFCNLCYNINKIDMLLLTKIKPINQSVMKREIVKIDEALCDGCGLCIPNCHEGALQIIDGKAHLVSDLMCDGLGACLGHCPQDAITIENREAEPYDEIKVMQEMVKKGKNVVIAHLTHLKEHNEDEFLKQGIEFLNSNEKNINFNIKEVMELINKTDHQEEENKSCGCQGSNPVSFNNNTIPVFGGNIVQDTPSALTHWPVQMHLINPAASYFQGTDLLLASDCSAFTAGDFHNKFLKGKTLTIACPKLDSGIEVYISKVKSLIEDAKINTITVLMMEVPCCGGLLQIAQQALKNANRKIPVKMLIMSIRGEIIKEEWV